MSGKPVEASASLSAAVDAMGSKAVLLGLPWPNGHRPQVRDRVDAAAALSWAWLSRAARSKALEVPRREPCAACVPCVAVGPPRDVAWTP